PALDTMPLLRALLSGKGRMQNSYLTAKHLVQIGGDCRGKPDFRDEKNCGPPGMEHGFHCGQIDGRFARSGYAMQQYSGKCGCSHRALNVLQGILLSSVKLKIK